MSKLSTKRNGAVALALAVGLVVGTAGVGIATDSRQLPADKTAVAGSALVDLGPSQEHPILRQRMKVSSPADLILGTTLECSILTRLVTDNSNQGTGIAEGAVDIRIEIDGKPVPVQTAGFAANQPNDDGEVTFCNRTYQRKVTEGENPADGIDREEDYIDTKTANAFNWVALNVGVDAAEGGYDTLANGNNIVDIVVFARYTRTAEGCTITSTTSCANAYVGKRTLVIEPVHAARGEQSEPAGASTSGSGGLSLPTP